MKKITIFFLIAFLSFSAQAQESKRFPTLSGKTFNGAVFDLKNLRGRVVVVNFWATWCADCRNELAILNEIYRKYNKQGVEIIGISTDRKKDREQVMKMIAGLQYLNVSADDLIKNDFADVSILPTSYVINRRGQLSRVIVTDNPVTFKDFEDAIVSILHQ